MEPKIVFDGIFFQIANSGIARVWRTLFQEWSESFLLHGAVIIDRGKTCPRFDSYIYEDLPKYQFSASAKDAFTLEEICQKHNADLFISTYFTTPISIPSVMMIYDMIPEKFDFDMNLSGWQEKTLAIHHARGFICISHNTAKDLKRFYPQIPESSILVSHLGVNRKVFYPRSQPEITAIRNKYGIEKDYYLFVGSRSQEKGYKNAKLFFDSLPLVQNKNFSVVCVGGQPYLEEYIESSTKDINIHLHQVDDEELSILYSDAIALVYPSLYEGFGLPIIEAMACGCPVITTKEGSIPEASGDAAYTISGSDRVEMAEAIARVRESKIRARLIDRGLKQAAKFNWKKTANTIYDALVKTNEFKTQSRQPEIAECWQQYRRVLQQIQ